MSAVAALDGYIPNHTAVVAKDFAVGRSPDRMAEGKASRRVAAAVNNRAGETEEDDSDTAGSDTVVVPPCCQCRLLCALGGRLPEDCCRSGSDQT